MSEVSPKQNTEARLTILRPTRRAGSRRTRSQSECRLAGLGGRLFSDSPAGRRSLQVLEQASVAEVVDVSTEKDQFRVDVIGHTVVGGHCVAYSGWHNEGGGTVEHAVPTASYQGTKSEEGEKYFYTNSEVFFFFLWT